MANPAGEVNRVVRTVIEAADPALQPVVKLRRFVVKRVEMVGGRASGSTRRHEGTPGTARSSGSKRPGTADNLGK